MNDIHLHCQAVKRFKSKNGERYCVSSHGYRLVSNGRYEHDVLAEMALGKPLPKGACVHHVNGIKTDNRPENLVVCPSTTYHLLIHRRERALDACGNPNWRKCGYCGKYDDPANMQPRRQSTGSIAHKECSLAYARERRSARRQEVLQ